MKIRAEDPPGENQIEEALKSKALEHFVLLVTPGARDRRIAIRRRVGKILT
jgi:hypothetical protein